MPYYVLVCYSEHSNCIHTIIKPLTQPFFYLKNEFIKGQKLLILVWLSHTNNL